MQTFTGGQYIKIAMANAFGLDKDLFETRIEFADGLISNNILHDKSFRDVHVDNADEPALFLAALNAYRDAVNGVPTGYMMGLDACSSGPAIMGTIIGCKTTCESTGLINPSVRADLYGKVTGVMQMELIKEGIQFTALRDDVKDAVMTGFYGSVLKPKEIFGEETAELQAFYESLEHVAPGALYVMDMLLGSWQSYATEHRFTLPDGFEAIVPVTEMVDLTVEVDELAHATFTHRVEVNQGSERGLSIAAK